MKDPHNRERPKERAYDREESAMIGLVILLSVVLLVLAILQLHLIPALILRISPVKQRFAGGEAHTPVRVTK